MSDCTFCKIVAGEIPSKVVKESDLLFVFENIKPKAKPHFLIIPKKHYKDISEVDDKTWIEIKKVALELQKEHKLKGFRLVNNFGTSQAVMHLHVHFLGGVELSREL